MFRTLTPILNLLVAITIGGLLQTGVNLNIQAPAEVTAGTEFEVSVNIDKGDLESFSRLQQSFPAGLTATSSISSNADFTFEDKLVRFIWLRMPRQDNFTVTYKIKVDERVKGTFNIDGKFSYIDQNERKSVSISSEPIVILPSPDIDPSLIVDIHDFENAVVPFIAPAGTPEMACVRQTPQEALNGNGYIVNLLVNKEARQKFAKIEENIPAGYRAENIDPKEAIFTFKGGEAKFLWMNLPSDPYFTVSYRLIPTTSSAPPPQIDGKFSYLEEDKTISLDIRQTNRDLSSVAPNEVAQILASAGQAQLATTTQPKTEPKQTNTPQEVAQNTPKEIKQEEKKPVEPEVRAIETKPVSADNQSYLLEPENGIYYRVQLAAGHKKVDIKQYFRKYNLDKEVRIERHDGWNKYSVGSFPVYKEARDYRVHIWNTTVIDDAFVSAYNDGNRITVQEALMVADQKWYK